MYDHKVPRLDYTAFNIWKGATGMRTPFQHGASKLRAIDKAFEAAIGAKSDAALLDCLNTLKECIDDLDDKTRKTHQSPLETLLKIWNSEYADVTSRLEDKKAEETLVNINDWIDQNLPAQINTTGRYNVPGEDAKLRGVRRTCVTEQLKESNCHTTASAAQLIRVTKSFISSDGYWNPGSKCHFVVEHCSATLGQPCTVKINRVADQGAQVEEYVKAVFHRKKTEGTGLIAHTVGCNNVMSDDRFIQDPTWMQFFPGIKPGTAKHPNIFAGKETDFRKMFTST